MSELHDRVERAEAIARRSAIEQVSENLWFVPSQSGSGGYLVGISHAGRWECNCPDFRAHDLPCKHLLAVRLRKGGLPRKEAQDLNARRPRKSYGQNWTAYNQAQNAEVELFDQVLAELVEDVEDPTPAPKTGRHRLSLGDLLFCCVSKAYEDESLRIVKGHYDSYVASGWISGAPSQNMVSVTLRRPEITPILHELIAKSAIALSSMEETFAVDSSGFRTTSFGDYCREKHGAPSRNVWLKAHIIAGTTTHIIARIAVTDGHRADVLQLPGLVNGTVEGGFVVREVSGDKAYASGVNFDVVGRAGGIPYFMFKDNSRGRGKKQRVKSPFWKQMWHKWQQDPSAFLEHYHKRENVEAVFAAIKKKLGETINSRNPVAQINELLCKVLAYNITVLIHEAFESGIEIPGGPNRPGSNSASATPEPVVDSIPNSTITLPQSQWRGENN